MIPLKPNTFGAYANSIIFKTMAIMYPDETQCHL